MRLSLAALILSAITLAATVAPAALARSSEGLWNLDDGRGGIRFVGCGGKLCGDIVWLKEAAGPGRIGQRVLFNMQRTAQSLWSGTAINPEDG